MSLREAAACVKRNKYFLITSHINPEGDALGAELAFYKLIRKLGKSATIINEDRLPYEYGFLPGANKIKKFKKSSKDIKFDCFVILDCSDLSRCGQVSRLNTVNKTVLNIDHHISNERFGEVNWVEPHSSSTSEMIYSLYKKLRLPLDKETAVLLYVGICTDTGSFRYPNTTGLTHKAVSELLKYNLDIAQIYKNVYEDIPFQDIRLLTRILPDIRRFASGKIAWFQLRREISRIKTSFDLTEHVLSFARAIKGVEVAVLFKENLGREDEIRINFRSQGKIDVNRIAQVFGGGGHRTASGATVRGRIGEVRRKVLAKIKESL